MSTLMERGLAMLGRQSAKAAGGDVRYISGETTIDLKATYGKTDYQIDTGSEIRVLHTDRDFIVAAADLGIEPKPGDRITGVAGGSVYEVMPLGNDPCYRPCDAQGTLIRIHCKDISS